MCVCECVSVLRILAITTCHLNIKFIDRHGNNATHPAAYAPEQMANVVITIGHAPRVFGCERGLQFRKGLTVDKSQVDSVVRCFIIATSGRPTMLYHHCGCTWRKLTPFATEAVLTRIK